MGNLFKQRKFERAAKGVIEGIRIENSFKFHLAAGIIAIIVSFILGLNAVEWCLVLLVIWLVLLSEMFNTVIELLVRLHTAEYSELAAKLLDISAGAVLISSLVAAVIGTIIFGSRFFQLIM